MKYLIITLMVLSPLSYNIIEYNKNRFINIYIPHLDINDKEEIYFEYNCERNCDINISIYIEDESFEFTIYNKNFYSGNSEVIKDFFTLEGYLIQKDVTFNFVSEVNGDIFRKTLEYVFEEKRFFRFENYLSISDSYFQCINKNGSISSMSEFIEFNENVIDDTVKIPLSIFAFYYKNSQGLDLRYGECYLEICDYDRILNSMNQNQDIFIVPIDLALIEDKVYKSFKSPLYYDPNTLVMYSDYHQGLINASDTIYLPLVMNLMSKKLKFKLVIRNLGYMNIDIEMTMDIFFSKSIGGLCLQSEVCIYHE